MQGMAATLNPDDMKALGVYFSQQNAEADSRPRTPTLVRRGRSSFAAATRRPASRPAPPATRPNGAGLPKNYPRLAGQYARLHLRAAQGVQGGERGADKDGKDANGKIMATIAGRMTDAQMKAVAEYVAGLR